MLATAAYRKVFMKNIATKRVLSGIRASGRLHLGNYLGAVKGMLALQDDPDYETLYMVADAHTITTPYSPEELKHNRRAVIIDYLAAGLDPEKSILFLQSDVNEHFELAFYLSSLASVARMQHLPTFKEKVKQHPKDVTMALLNYPVLMAADILLYKANAVPVGTDQIPHLEIARELARKCNAQFGLNFPEPTRFATTGEYVPSLKGEGKMSKSVEGSYINLSDNLDAIKQRLAGAPTDSGQGEIKQVNVEADQPTTSVKAEKIYIDGQTKAESLGVRNLLILVELFEGAEKRKTYEASYQDQGIRYNQLKTDLAEAIYAELQPLQERRAKLFADPTYINQVIEQGAQKARNIAQQTVKELRTKMGLV